MNIALVSIGSNENREQNMLLSCRLLTELFPDIIFSDTCVTIPYGLNYKNDFLNRLAIINTEAEQLEVNETLKLLEKEIGRSSTDKQKGLVKIDLDLVKWNDEILKPKDMERSYIKDLLLTFEFTDNKAETSRISHP